MAKKILVLNFDNRKKAALEEKLAQLGGGYEVESIQTPEALKDFNEKIHSLFYMHTKGANDFEKDIESVHKIQRNLPINVIFKKRDFEVLLRAFELPLSMVLDKKYTTGELQKALLRSDLRNFQTEDFDLPMKNLLDLLSSPIKVKSDRDLYRKLYAYFKSFPETIEFSIYQVDQKNFELVEGPKIEKREIFQAIKEEELPKIFIGKVLEVQMDERRVCCAFPVYKEEGEKESWCVCFLEKERKNYVLNDLFFRHLENTLIYRKNLEKMSGYLDLANKDDVTGLFNQRKLVADLAKTIEYHEMAEKTFSVMFLDVDHFKLVNDNFGHIVGSQMLVEIAQELKKVLRSTDKIYRYGGDEFVVIMPEAKMETVHKIAVRVRESVKEKTFNIGVAKNYQLSLSIGIAEYPTDAETANEIIDFADSMMYVSKKSGRGKIFHIGEVQNDIADSE